MIKMLTAARAAKQGVASLTTEQKNNALLKMADALENNTQKILDANAIDVQKSMGVISNVMIDRLMLNADRVKAMADGIRDVANLPDPVGHTLKEYTREDGLKITRVSVPIGVIAIIYESRPNVTSDAAALSLKSGNVCVLRGGKEAINSAIAIVEALREGLRAADVDENAVNLVTDTTRESANALMKANGYVDMLIPRGGAGLINACINNATVPCIQTGTGICHIYVEKTADIDMAVSIINNAKTSRPSVCNAAEVLLVDNEIKEEILPRVYDKLVKERKENGLIPVELRLDDNALSVIDGTPIADNDYDTEFLDYILAVKCIKNVDEAVEHISMLSTGHSEAIISSNDNAIAKFTSGVDSAAVYVNASTRFTDGGEFGLGCEMGISTQKLHARGPMGLQELTTYKYIINGNGHIR
ncbi:MAG: glutamate-5-semialdehyde dehydrogenase [Clostridia bacterium]|nr:glutamate-5-semialdehyde dehydrogenase [Clostridia bacterium]